MILIKYFGAIFISAALLIPFILNPPTPSLEGIISDSCSEYLKINDYGHVFYEGHAPINGRHMDSTSEIFKGDNEFSLHVNTLYLGPALESDIVKCVAEGLEIPLEKLPIVYSKPLYDAPFYGGCDSAPYYEDYVCDEGGYLWLKKGFEPRTYIHEGTYGIKIIITGTSGPSCILKFSKSR